MRKTSQDAVSLVKSWLLGCVILFLMVHQVYGQAAQKNDSFTDPLQVKGFHLDLRIQVMTIKALKQFASKLKAAGLNTLIMEWEGTYPFENHPLISNRYAYTKAEVKSFIQYCDSLGIDVIPLQQSFGHVEYILRNERYKSLREDQKDYSQVCPLETVGDSLLFRDLYSELITTHHSRYIHIGGDETYLLGHDDRCKAKAALEGKSKLYIDYIRMLCNTVISLGKTPVLWADIALKYPDAIKLLPKGTIFIDWNYGWDMNHFGDHNKLMESGYEVWGAPSLRSSPDNYAVTQWEKHFDNIRDFIPASRQQGYRGMIMTSWSTSGIYSSIFESSSDIIDLYAIRHVYPLSGFNILLAAYQEALRSKSPLDLANFMQKYCLDQYGLNKGQTDRFWQALTAAPYEVRQGEVVSPDKSMSISQLLDSARFSASVLASLNPSKGQEEFAHFKLMADIRVHYLTYQWLELKANQPDFSGSEREKVILALKQLVTEGKGLDERFAKLNEGFLYPAEIASENELRNSKVTKLYERLSRSR